MAMRKEGIVEYVILEGSAAHVQKLVEERLDEGWVTLGGVAAAVSRSLRGDSEHVFAQAMVRTATNKKNLSMTVPMAVIGDTKGATTVNIPNAMTSGTMLPCPHCQKPVRIRNLRDGINRCEKCQREFVAEWDA